MGWSSIFRVVKLLLYFNPYDDDTEINNLNNATILTWSDLKNNW